MRIRQEERRKIYRDVQCRNVIAIILAFYKFCFNITLTKFKFPIYLNIIDEYIYLEIRSEIVLQCAFCTHKKCVYIIKFVMTLINESIHFSFDIQRINSDSVNRKNDQRTEEKLIRLKRDESNYA